MKNLVLATLYHVDCHYSYMKEDDVAPYTFGSLEGAKQFVEEQKSKDLTWYSIKGLEYRPCDDNNPGGQLYMGMIYFDYQEVR